MNKKYIVLPNKDIQQLPDRERPKESDYSYFIVAAAASEEMKQDLINWQYEADRMPIYQTSDELKKVIKEGDVIELAKDFKFWVGPPEEWMPTYNNPDDPPVIRIAVPVENGFPKEEMQKVQYDIDSVNKGAIVDRSKLLGISSIGNDELCDIIQNACQLINGFKPDAVGGNYWSEWDESVLQSLIEILKKLQPVYGQSLNQTTQL